MIFVRISGVSIKSLIMTAIDFEHNKLYLISKESILKVEISYIKLFRIGGH